MTFVRGFSEDNRDYVADDDLGICDVFASLGRWRLLIIQSVDVDERRRRFGNQGRLLDGAVVNSTIVGSDILCREEYFVELGVVFFL